jgi:hypothetical protein
MIDRLSWKRANESGQVMSLCGRYWIGPLDDGSFRLWHDDSDTEVGVYSSQAASRDSAQAHLFGLKVRTI